MTKRTLILTFVLWTGGLCTGRPALAQSVTLGGISFNLPAELVPQTGRPEPIVLSWKNEAGTVSVDAIKVPHSDLPAAVKEFQDWPDVGRSMAASFGDANVRVLQQASNAKCSYEGVPVAHDLQRMALQVRVETTCATSPEPTQLHSLVINVLTKSEQIVFRIDAQPSAYAEAQTAATEIWRTLRVADAERVVAVTQPSAGVTTGEAPASAKPVFGGTGFRLTDYGLVRTEALLAELAGALFAAVLFGALVALLLMQLGLKPLPSLIGTQVFLILLRLWGNEEDGVWEFDWVVSILPAIIAIVLLYRWAERRWAKRLATKLT